MHLLHQNVEAPSHLPENFNRRSYVDWQILRRSYRHRCLKFRFPLFDFQPVNLHVICCFILFSFYFTLVRKPYHDVINRWSQCRKYFSFLLLVSILFVQLFEPNCNPISKQKSVEIPAAKRSTNRSPHSVLPVTWGTIPVWSQRKILSFPVQLSSQDPRDAPTFIFHFQFEVPIVTFPKDRIRNLSCPGLLRAENPACCFSL